MLDYLLHLLGAVWSFVTTNPAALGALTILATFTIWSLLAPPADGPEGEKECER